MKKYLWGASLFIAILSIGQNSNAPQAKTKYGIVEGVEVGVLAVGFNN